MTLTDAIIADQSEQYERAAALYEEAIAEKESDAMAWINLAILYWQATDPGNFKARTIALRAGERFPIILQEARERFADNTEIEFWIKYIAWTDFGGSLSVSECIDLLHRDKRNLVPLVYLYSHTIDDEFEKLAWRLLDQYRNDRTARTRYIVSVIESAMTSKQWG